MAPITSKQAQDYLNRWKLLHEVEIQELRSASLDLKARQLATLMASRNLFREDHDRQKDVDAVRQRWSRIREAFRG